MEGAGVVVPGVAKHPSDRLMRTKREMKMRESIVTDEMIESVKGWDEGKSLSALTWNVQGSQGKGRFEPLKKTTCTVKTCIVIVSENGQYKEDRAVNRETNHHSVRPIVLLFGGTGPEASYNLLPSMLSITSDCISSLEKSVYWSRYNIELNGVYFCNRYVKIFRKEMLNNI